MPLIQDVPMLTVYRNGYVNLNGEATRLMHDRHRQADLLPPVNARHPWQLDRRAGASCNLLKGGRDGSHLRFSAPYRAAELFRQQPASVKRIVFRITPHTQFLDMYTLAAELPLFTQKRNIAT
ncbi:hypothetical protein HER32_11910 [Hymenobacter sp. BT18]|uniref:hypothetical protein n=1 Tax=Hymenobacter sp. BT18 TaxID=2835648 RepID=UPI00143E1CBD|nr:hypothetical protein [Hymenobacter sp. BT18]QIX61847.1 hypothetical protein HER32_11910 [Hymenobacter sp. BT18]